ncbi:LPS export ABC transporter periplasmic protein LptC [Candidatus Hydrogenedentota bacterium]
MFAIILASCSQEPGDMSAPDKVENAAQEAENDANLQSTGENREDSAISAVRITHYGPMLPDGRYEYLIHAKRVSGDEGEELVFEDVEITLADKDGPGEHTVTADKGRFTTETKAGEMEGNVHLTGSNISLDTERIEWDEGMKNLTSDTPVTWLYDTAGSITKGKGEGFRVRKEEGLVTILKPSFTMVFNEGEQQQ